MSGQIAKLTEAANEKGDTEPHGMTYHLPSMGDRQNGKEGDENNCCR